MKKLICILLILCMALSLCACGKFRYGVNAVEVLVEQDYYLAFRNNDPLYFYVTAALSVLAAEGRVDQLAAKWLGSAALNYSKQADALEKLVPPEPQNLIIGLDLDSFSPLGGTDVLQRCMQLVNNAQDLGYPGWKSFEDSRNRFAIINDYLDEQMKPFRQLQYDYYRKGLDEMVNNAERGRTEISTALEEQLKKAHDNKPLSLLPQIWTDYKKDELVNIYKGKGTQKEKQAVYDLLSSINASQNPSWEKINN